MKGHIQEKSPINVLSVVNATVVWGISISMQNGIMESSLLGVWYVDKVSCAGVLLLDT
jgi:hypothetical protein